MFFRCNIFGSEKSSLVDSAEHCYIVIWSYEPSWFLVPLSSAELNTVRRWIQSYSYRFKQLMTNLYPTQFIHFVGYMEQCRWIFCKILFSKIATLDNFNGLPSIISFFCAHQSFIFTHDYQLCFLFGIIVACFQGTRRVNE